MRYGRRHNVACKKRRVAFNVETPENISNFDSLHGTSGSQYNSTFGFCGTVDSKGNCDNDNYIIINKVIWSTDVNSEETRSINKTC